MLQSYKDIAAYELSTENVYLRINRLGKHRLVIHPFRTSCKRSINNELAFVITSVWQNRYRCIDELFVFLTLDCIGIVQQSWDFTSANVKMIHYYLLGLLLTDFASPSMRLIYQTYSCGQSVTNLIIYFLEDHLCSKII